VRWLPLFAFLLIGSSSSPPEEVVEIAPDEPAPPPEYQIDHENHQVIRLADGKPRWTTKLEGYLGRNRPPHLLWDVHRVYVTHQDGVTALDAETGKELWHSPGLNDRMLLSDDLLLATGSSPTEGRAMDCWVMARSTTDGRPTFKTKVDVIGFDPMPIEEMGGYFVVQAREHPGGSGDTCLLDRKGTVRHRLDRQVVAGLRKDDDVVLLTSGDVVRLAQDGKVRWTVAFDHQWIAGGGLIEVADDLVAFLYGRISDSGVQVIRFTPSTGRVTWRTACRGLGVEHSEYQHRATVALVENQLRVASRASGGASDEVLDVKTGRQLKRSVGKQK
jgi:outer membrane protein assembly factor BamB